MRCRLIGLGLILMLAMSSVGCYGARETDEVAYIVSIGIDREPDGQFKVSYQIAVPRKAGGGSSGGEGETSGGGNPSVVVSIVAPSIAEARNLMETSVARVPNLSHNKAFIISEELAKEGMGKMLGPLMRYREYRGTMYIFVCRGTARDFITSVKPTLEALPAKYLELMQLAFNDTGYYPRVFLHDFYQQLKSPSGEAYAVYVSTHDTKGEGDGKGDLGKTPGSQVRNYVAGGTTRQGGNPVAFMGTAMFNKDKMVGVLNNTQTRAMVILKGENWHSFVTVDDPLQPDTQVTVNLRLGRKPKLDANYRDGQASISADVLLEGEISSLPSGVAYETSEYRGYLEEQISNVMREQILSMIEASQAVDSDVVGFGYHLRSKFRTHQEVEDLDWFKAYRTAAVDVKVTTKIRRTGLQLQTSELRM